MAASNSTDFNSQKYTVLIVDDTPTNLSVVADYLESCGFEIMMAQSGEKALKRVRYIRPDIILLDVMMPGLDGFETCRRLKAGEDSKNIPVIFMTALVNTEDKVKGFELGAVDYVTKPLQQEEVMARITTHLQIRNLTLSLQKANEKLTELNSSKDQFFSSIAQELREPFNTLLNSAYFMLRQKEGLTKEELQKLPQQIYSSAGTIHSLVETLMTWSSLQRVHMKYPPDELNLRELAFKAVELHQDTAGRKNIELNNDIEQDVFVCTDGTMLATVIHNLIANALKFTLSGGWVTLSARPAASSSGDPGQEAVEFIELSVTDMGVGISQENLAKLFRMDMLHTTPGTAQEQGAGLGLIMCKEMVEHNGGKIWIESKAGRGTTVSFTAPVAGLEGCS